jgi:hypothetical protein
LIFWQAWLPRRAESLEDAAETYQGHAKPSLVFGFKKKILYQKLDFRHFLYQKM